MEISHKFFNPLKRFRSYDEQEDNIEREDTIILGLELIISSIRQMSGNKMDYRDFENFQDSMDIDNYIWRYMEFMNKNANDIGIENICKIRQYWSYFRNFLPLIFNFPHEYLNTEDDHRVVDSFKTSIVSTIVDKEDKYDEQLDKLNNWRSKIEKVEEFVNIHKNLSILQDDDLKDLNILRILKLYILALNQVIEQDYDRKTYEYTELLLSIY